MDYNRPFPANVADRPGIVAKFSCGYQRMLFGARSATCNSAGQWTYTNGAPVCISKTFTYYSFTTFDDLYFFV